MNQSLSFIPLRLCGHTSFTSIKLNHYQIACALLRFEIIFASLSLDAVLFDSTETGGMRQVDAKCLHHLPVSVVPA
jgi:hypothetical protein